MIGTHPRSRAAARAAVLAAVLLLAPLAGAQEAPPPDPPPAPKADEEEARLQELLDQAIPAVEKTRGLAFRERPAVAPVSEEAYVEKYMRDLTRVLGGEERIGATSRLLERLGVLEKGTDFREILGRFLKGNIAAVYDPLTKAVSFLPRANRTLFLMMHELTHALDDQHFDMEAEVKSWNGEFDVALAYGALAEGDAESVEKRAMLGPGMAEQPLEQLRTMAEVMAGNILRGKFGGTPPALVLAFKSQYIEGALFVESLRRGPKGEEAVNGAFRSPPASTEQILHPEKYQAGEQPIRVALAAPPEGAKVLLATPLGELGSRVVLLAHGTAVPVATDAAAGWGGDTVALVSFPGGLEAVIWATTWDTAEDADAFHKALQAAFPLSTGETSDKVTRVIIRREKIEFGHDVVEYVEAPLDVLPDALEMAKKATRTIREATPREGVLGK